MRKFPTHSLFIAIGALSLPSAAFAVIPTNAKIFAPYLEIDAGDNDTSKLTSIAATTGSKYYTLAFMNENTAGTNVIWGSGGSVSATGSNPAYISQINSLRSEGGDVIFSFGGAEDNSYEPANFPGMTLATLEQQYENVVTAYHATWLDFDIEGSSLSSTTENNMRNAALLYVQQLNPGLQISYTLAADPSGLDTNGFKLLQNAASIGLQIRTVNAMTMDFGTSEIKNTTVSAVAITTATAVHNEIKSTLPNTDIGMTVLIGQSDNVGEVFQLTDAQPVLNFAQSTSWIDFLSMWSIDRDNGTKVDTTDDNTDSGIIQSPYFFTDTFKAFTTPEPTSLLLFLPALVLLRRKGTRSVSAGQSTSHQRGTF